MFPSTPPPQKGLRATLHAGSTSPVSTSESGTTPIAAESTAPSVFDTLTAPETPNTPPQTPFPSAPPCPPSSQTALTCAAKSKAYYRLIRLDKQEIDHRNEAGKCTYCSEMGHSRRSCAAGRIMRKVSKRVLDSRLRSGVCPLCGDPKADGHSKLTCPEKQTLQATLNEKRGMGHDKHGAAGAAHSSTSSTSSSTLHEGTADSAQHGKSRRMNKSMRRHMPQAATQARARNNDNSNGRFNVAARTRSVLTQSLDVDLIDLGRAGDDGSSTTSSTGSLNSSATSTTGTTLGGPYTPSPKFATITSFSSSFQNRCTKQNLLDMAATEVVWGGVSLPVAKIGLGHGLGPSLGLGLGFGMDMDMDVDDGADYASQSWDFIKT